MFSSILVGQLNNPFFLDRALSRLDVFIADKTLSFSAEDVICTMTDSMLCIDDGSTKIDKLVSEAIRRTPRSLSRLNDSLHNHQFVYEALSCEYSYEKGLFPTSIIANLISRNYDDEHFSIESIVSRLKSTLNISHTNAKTLIAKACGFRNGNELQRFANMLPQFLYLWVSFLWCLCPTRNFFQEILDQANEFLPKFPTYNNVNVRYENDEIMSRITLYGKGDMLLEFRDAASLHDDKYRDLYNSIAQNAIKEYTTHLDGFFYRHLYDFAICHPFNSSDKQSEAMQCIFTSIVRECLTSSVTLPLLGFKRHILANSIGLCRTVEVTAKEVEYNFFKYLLTGSSMFLTTEQSTDLKNRMQAVGNNFVPSVETDSNLALLFNLAGGTSPTRS